MSLSLCIASVNLQHWISAGGIMIDGRERTLADYSSKMRWAQQTFSSLTPRAAVIGFQEVYDQSSVDAIFSAPALANQGYHCYLSGGAPQQVCLATTLPLQGPIETIQKLAEPIRIDRAGLVMEVSELSRPILKARLLHEGEPITVFVVHLKSKLPNFGDDLTKTYPEEELLTADFGARALGCLVSLARRGAEAAALRREVVRELEGTDNPVIVLGDCNAASVEVPVEMILGDRTTAYIENYKSYTKEQIAQIRRRLHRTVLTSAQEVQMKCNALDGYYTSIHDGMPCTIDHIFLSRHFFRMPPGIDDPSFRQRYFFNYYDVLNDHLVDREPQFAPDKPMTSDHGVAVAYLKKIKPPAPAELGTARGAAPGARSDLEIR